MTNKRCSFYQSDREVRLLVIHCSATRCDRAFPVEALRAAHFARGFADIIHKACPCFDAQKEYEAIVHPLPS